MAAAQRRVVMSAADMGRAMSRIAHEIIERNRGAASLVLVGIPRPGPVLAERLAGLIETIEGRQVPTGAVDPTMHRDDLDRRSIGPQVHPSHIPVDVTDRTVVLVDDVLYTGRTLRAALDALNDFGRPRAIQFAAIVDRGHRELPVRADFVGKNLPTADDERVTVRLQELDGEDAVHIERVTRAAREATPAA
ncbi:MAG: bifunctional pyr operon transcriptional regulator/uracil phosphoribosyltransferase PyrR [Chloroflexi bacterium]|nr:bifunctional pyr operon transcriptional regulator/uracil phosphoribosyltransferase PyrR [Chloroflexota bacterium]